MKERVLTKTSSLKSGMIIDQEIADESGRMLIGRGGRLDNSKIASLIRLKVEEVYVLSDVDRQDKDEEQKISPKTREIIEENIVKDRAKVELTESVKERVKEGIQYLYSNTESEEFSDTTNNIAGHLMRTITENNAIAVDIDALKVSDEYTFKHSVDVAAMAMIIAKKYGLSDREIYEIGVAGLLHDIGKSKIPPEILNKPGRLTDDEFAIMKQHSLIGYKILKDKADISEAVRLGVLQHHEKINGSGYPMGVASGKISIYARILAVADIYDALVTERPYKKGFSKRDAVEMIMSMTAELDFDAMKSFLGSVILYPVNSTVELSNGETARVVENDPDCILRPKVVGLRTGRIYNLSSDIGCANVVIM